MIRSGTTLIIVLLVALPHAASAQNYALRWVAIDSLNARLPDAVRVYHARNDRLPLRAWYVRIRERDARAQTRVVTSDDSDGKEPVSGFAADAGVCVAANAGYFDMRADPATHVGLVYTDGRVVAEATGRVERSGQTIVTARAALGLGADGLVDVAWVTSSGDSLYAWSNPPSASDEPGSLDLRLHTPWHVSSAVGAGPMLLRGGERRITVIEEGFSGTSIPSTHPRTAVGRTADGDLLIMVVDGRQPESRGVSLEELSVLMTEIGAVDALNLDGGGSSTLVVAGTRLNRPAGGDVERQVVSALVTTCR